MLHVWVRRACLVIAALVVGSSLATGVARAGPEGPADFGTMEPKGLAASACPWPDGANAFMEQVQGVQKCLPQAIPWSFEESPFGPQSGVRIVFDSLVPAEPGSLGSGQVTFWCQARTGLHYRITVQGLPPLSTFEVTATEVGSDVTHSLGTVRTDPSGNGVSAGVLQLPKGGYEFLVTVGSELVPDPADPVIGFSVL